MYPSLALAGYRDSRSFQRSCSVPSRRCLDTCKTVSKWEGENCQWYLCNNGTFLKTLVSFGSSANGFNLYPGPGCSLIARRCPGVLRFRPSLLLVESFPLVRYTGSAHFSHPVSCLEIELCKGWQCRGVQRFPLSSVGPLGGWSRSMHCPLVYPDHVDQEDGQVREKICRKWHHLLCKKNPALSAAV